MRRIIVLSDEEVKNIAEGEEVTFEAFGDVFVLVNEGCFEKMKVNNHYKSYAAVNKEQRGGI